MSSYRAQIIFGRVPAARMPQYRVAKFAGLGGTDDQYKIAYLGGLLPSSGLKRAKKIFPGSSALEPSPGFYSGGSPIHRTTQNLDSNVS
jgi:hypothetical protein